MTGIGLQLYTVRDDLGKDFNGTLKRVAAAGYRFIEGGPGKGMSPADYKALCAQLGLSPVAGGLGLDGLEKDLDGSMKRLAEFGAKYAMLGWMAPERRDSVGAWRAVAKLMNGWGKAARDHGITFQYHNHDMEFTPMDGTNGLEIILGETDPALVKMQVDVGWVTWAGQDPVSLLRKLGKGRVRVIHLKDLRLAPDKHWMEVGNGVLNLKGVVTACKELEIEYAFVEQDTCERPPLDAIAISHANAVKAFA